MKKKFHSVKLSELDEVEKLYKVKIQVYPLKPIEKTTKKMNLISRPLHWSAVRTAMKQYLNLYEYHFSYIKDLARYSRSFCCSHCGKYWNKGSRWSRHEETCDRKVQLKYPGGE